MPEKAARQLLQVAKLAEQQTVAFLGIHGLVGSETCARARCAWIHQQTSIYDFLAQLLQATGSPG